MRIKKGDQVKILTGKDRGRVGRVLKVLRSEERVTVEKVNMVKKHRKARTQQEKSERVMIPAPINVSNVQLVCPKCDKITRIGIKRVQDKNVRVCKKCAAEV
ncbi:MAG TPA: 50S ribosomal protein L24 [Candidatus Moranbacteria bacterium]|nr:50S ribosomal protein L24 [Candidatus Moranbacteria bacterium]